MDLTNYKGLTENEVLEILKLEGYNELPSQKKKNFFVLFFKIIKEPMFLLLISAGLIYLFLGDINDSLMLLFAIFIVIGITFYQERKTEKTLEALKDLSSPKALVIRDGDEKKINGREIVPNDIVIIHEGDRIPADGIVLYEESLTVDESLLTGESVPVTKTDEKKENDNILVGDDNNSFVYSGTLVTSGRAIIQVKMTGIKTEIGKIGKSLETIKEEDTLLNKETSKIVRYAASIALSLCFFVLLFYLFFKNDLINGLLSGLTLGMAIIPEEFPVVLIIFLTLGAWRISKKNVLTRKKAVIETLGAATVLCVDKTGTITLNKMQLSVLYTHNNFYEIDPNLEKHISVEFKELLEFGMLANKKNPFDPMEKELNRVGEFYIKGPKHLDIDWEILKEFPLSKDLLAFSHIWKNKKNNEKILASKGAPEAILHLCHIDGNEKDKILNKVHEMSSRGLRVLGVARGKYNDDVIPSNQHDFNFEFVGLLGFIDPERKNVNESIKETYEAGMRVIMITGDYPGTAKYIAKKVGIKNYDQVITGDELYHMSDLELAEKIKVINIFARIIPEQKLKIINALKSNGEIVAMTGDGVNDAPALKSAHIGISMGERGTDVAREASDIILLNDDFSSIVSAVSLGRRIYDNIKRAMGYLLAVHIPIAGISVLPLLFNYPSVLLPAHVAFLELIIDPACSTVFEGEKGSRFIMKRPPRNLKETIFNRKNIFILFLQGFVSLIICFLLFYFAIKNGMSENESRTFAFASLVLSNIFLITINLSWDKGILKIFKEANKVFYCVFFGAIVSLLVVIYVEPVASLFHLSRIDVKYFLIIFIISFVGVSWFEILKLFKKQLQIN